MRRPPSASAPHSPMFVVRRRPRVLRPPRRPRPHAQRPPRPSCVPCASPPPRAVPFPAFLHTLLATARRRARPLPTTVGSLSDASSADIFARAAPCHRVGHLLTARDDAQQRLFTPLLSPSSTRPARSGATPCPAGTALWPSPSSPSLDLSLPRPSRSDPCCRSLLGSIRCPFGRIVSSRLDPSLP
jgi:hypothetical protein